MTVVDVNYGELAPDQPKPDVAMIIAAWFDANCEMRHCNLPSTIFYVVEERTLLERLAEDEAMDVAESSI